MLSDVLEQLEYSRHLSLCEQIDLKVQMAPLIGLASQAILAGEYEQRQEDGLQRDRHRQEREWKRIEGTNASDRASIDGDPCAEPDDVKDENGSLTRGAGDPVAHPFCL
jgi:hypothetical protein